MLVLDDLDMVSDERLWPRSATSPSGSRRPLADGGKIARHGLRGLTTVSAIDHAADSANARSFTAQEIDNGEHR